MVNRFMDSRVSLVKETEKNQLELDRLYNQRIDARSRTIIPPFHHKNKKRVQKGGPK